MKNKIITSEGNIQFIDSEGKVINISPSQVYSMINEDTISFLLVHLPKSSGLSLFTTKVEDLELNGTTYSQSTIADALAEAFSEAGAVGRIEVVDELPSKGKTNTIYLLPKDEGEGYDEYIYIKDESKWELIGDTSVEIKNYLKKSDFNEYSAATKTAIDSKQGTLIAGENITISGNVISATGGDLSNYYTKSETSGATQISTALASKADTATTYTKTDVDNAITAATNTKQDQLVSGTNIKTINNESILGTGNIEIQGGGGKAVSAGTNISITTGETADTINCTVPYHKLDGGSNYSIYGTTNKNNVYDANETLFIGESNEVTGNWASRTYYRNCVIGYNNKINANIKNYLKGYNVVIGDHNTLSGTDLSYSYVIGKNNSGYTSNTLLIGWYNQAYNGYESALGTRNVSVSGSTTFGDSGNTLFSVGNGRGNGAINVHNAFEIRQNGDIYIADTNDTSTTNYYEKPMIKLQDALGGTVDTALDSGSTNPVENRVIYNKIDEVEQVTARALNELNETLSGKADSNSVYTKTEANVLLDEKLDVTAYTPTDLNNYYTKSETSGATQISTALDDKLDTSNFNTYTAATNSRLSEDEEVTAASLNALNDAFGGLKLVKLSQAEYNALATKDSQTLYIIVG